MDIDFDIDEVKNELTLEEREAFNQIKDGDILAAILDAEVEWNEEEKVIKLVQKRKWDPLDDLCSSEDVEMKLEQNTEFEKILERSDIDDDLLDQVTTNANLDYENRAPHVKTISSNEILKKVNKTITESKKASAAEDLSDMDLDNIVEFENF